MRLQGYSVLFLFTIYSKILVSTALAEHLETQLQLNKVLEIVETIPKTKTIGNCSLYCRVYRLLKNIINNLKKFDKPIIIVSGLEIVPTKDANVTVDWKSKYDNDEEASLIDNFSEFLQTHEMNIKFSDLLKDTTNNSSLIEFDENQDESKMQGRKKDKEQGILMTMSVMFAKMMALLGIGGIGLLALKALGVASTALVLAGLMGIKSLAQHGTEATHTHSVQYVATDGHLHNLRRRRSSFNNTKKPLPMAYRAWDEYVI